MLARPSLRFVNFPNTAMQLDTLKRKTKNRKIKRLGRAGNRGKTSGRGTKGQKARAGHRIRPEIRDVIKRTPKRRGHGKNRATAVVHAFRPTVINVSTLEQFDNGTQITPEVLAQAKMVRKIGGRIPVIKILGTGELSKKLIFIGVSVSKSAQTKIEKAGGTIN